MCSDLSPIPDFDGNGNLPPGQYVVELGDIEKKLTWSQRRKDLFEGLRKVVINLAMAGVKRIYVDGSFTTTKEDPGDIDGCWEPNGQMDCTKLDPVFLDLNPPRMRMKQKYGVDFLIAGAQAHPGGPLVQDFFQMSRDADRKGILVLEFSNVSSRNIGK